MTSGHESRLGARRRWPSANTIAAVVGGALIGAHVLLVFFFSPPITLGHDTEHFLHWASANFEYASSPADLSVISPFQGLGGLVQPLGVWLNPAYCVPHLLHSGDPRVAGFPAVMIVMAIATFMLGRAVGLPPWLAILGAQFTSIISFPPVWMWSWPTTHHNGVMLYGLAWGCAIPPALATLFLAMYCYLGQLSRRGNVACLILMPVLLVYAILCDPLYTGMFFVTIGFFLAGVFFGSGSRQVFLWRASGGAVCILTFLILNLHNFYRALFGYAARAVFPNELYVEVQQWDVYTGLLYQGGLATVCMILLIFSCGLACAFGNRLMRGFAASVLVFVGLIAGVCLVYVYSGIRWHLPLPVYMEVPAQPTYVVAGLLGVWLGLRKLAELLRARAPAGAKSRLLHRTAVATCFGMVLLMPFWGAYVVYAMPTPGNASAQTAPAGLTPPRKADRSPAVAHSGDRPMHIVQFLQDELAIAEDGLFRGSVANLIGVPGGPLMDRIGVPEEAPFEKNHLMFLDAYRRSFHPYLAISGLWDLRIPTLEDNNHLVTPPLHFLFSHLLSRPQDYHSRNWALVTVARPRLMAALGTRFLLTDRRQSDARLTLRFRQSNADGVVAHVYEIRDANLGGYSPTQCVVATDALQMISLMKDEQFAFEDVAIVDAPLSGSLSRATFGRLFFEKGGVRVEAKSASGGQSLLVLPVQFSNSLCIIDAKTSLKDAPLRLLRVNMVETGLLFSGAVEVKFAHRFGPFRGVAGRLRDIDDCRRLGIRETGAIPYPHDYQPLGPDGWKLERGLRPSGDDPQQVEAFLKTGGQTWRTPAPDASLTPDGELWIWPVTDRVLRNGSDSNFAPFQIHWRLRSSNAIPPQALVYVFEVQGKAVGGALPPCGTAREGIVNCALNMEGLSGDGVVPFYWITAGSSSKRCSNVLLLTVKVQPGGHSP